MVSGRGQGAPGAGRGGRPACTTRARTQVARGLVAGVAYSDNVENDWAWESRAHMRKFHEDKLRRENPERYKRYVRFKNKEQ